MRMSQRLLALIGLATAGLLFLAVINVAQIRTVHEKTGYANVNVVPSILLLNKAMEEFSHIRVRAYRHALSDDVEVKQGLEKALDEAEDNLEKALTDYAPLASDDQDKRLLETDHELLKRYMTTTRQVISVSNSGYREEALSLLTQNAKPAEALNDAFVAHMAYNRQLGQEHEREAAATERSATYTAIALVLAVILAVCTLGFFTYRHTVRSLGLANTIADRVASGDLRPSAQRNLPNDEIGHLLRRLEGMRASLQETVRALGDNANHLHGSAEQLTGVAGQVSQASEHQSSSTASAAAAVEELTVSIDVVGGGAEDASHRAAQAGELARQSNSEVSGAVEGIRKVSSQIGLTAERLTALSAQVAQIGSISVVIRELAEQTNLLALNAAIEAARAGEHGRGFAVVADEVRKLAERTTTSVQEINQVIDAIQHGAQDAVDSMQTSRDSVTGVLGAADSASRSMEEICQATDTVQQAIADISLALKEQRVTSSELARSVETIAQMSDENARAVASLSDASNELLGISRSLTDTTARFTVN
ncbi:MAG: hypothetical protein CGU29_04975 [Candidatus Dactylopiibacterium carminicum]|uniref:Methyl-accepting chemotaxis protein n=1 Tax=Candidatus Dactylopiibacterium carminicum TaxID=857335 RepID=A0A272EVP6_9RHOO|nr:methyl-accepting chemotaxis protein [Candidatus Dactylopiibacterium carminicum]KAF7599884.1 methyl-accepting chemotaxis protein [Candidatus Dactylopiibacterium carminicum]PAS94177.1 MAG: hypothetical protein CGU29_04975 [Candidatus Dactylopiibacterium carminicum]PAS99883.1 MAG: hypothetical protein BSR46_05400 [Candidatus Dactylopiibacterium carminicum]